MAIPLRRSPVDTMRGRHSFGRGTTAHQRWNSLDCIRRGAPDRGSGRDDELARSGRQDLEPTLTRVEDHEILDADPRLAVQVDAGLDREDGRRGERLLGGAKAE